MRLLPNLVDSRELAAVRVDLAVAQAQLQRERASFQTDLRNEKAAVQKVDVAARHHEFYHGTWKGMARDLAVQIESMGGTPGYDVARTKVGELGYPSSRGWANVL